MKRKITDDQAASGPKVLLFDIETAPMLGYFWGLWDQSIGLNQIVSDWYVIAWAAKWLDAPETEIMYQDQRRAKNIEDDRALLKGIWELLDQADIVITQNGVRFDSKKLNARFLLAGMKPPSPYRHIDTYKIAKKHFALTSNKLEYMAEHLGVKHKKLAHKEFPGFELWRECLKGNPKAWREMELYNKNDVLALEGVYKRLQPWDRSIQFDTYHPHRFNRCNCGADNWQKRGFIYSNTGKFQRFQCQSCGAWASSKENLLSEVKRASLLK